MSGDENPRVFGAGMIAFMRGALAHIVVRSQIAISPAVEHRRSPLILVLLLCIGGRFLGHRAAVGVWVHHGKVGDVVRIVVVGQLVLMVAMMTGILHWL